QWFTNSSEVKGLQKLLGDGLSLSYASSKCDPRVGGRRWLFVCALELALDESLSHRHTGAVYHRGRSPSASVSESHGGGRDHDND
ncbi:hypothetical protein BHE74_00049873, partial [Ensete ventricosum]